MNEISIAEEITKLLPKAYYAGAILFLVILFKDIMASFAKNVFVYLKMRTTQKVYSVEGGIVEINREKFKIIKITLGSVYFKSLNGSKRRVRMSTSKYWNSIITYYEVEDIMKNFDDKEDYDG